MSPIQLDKMSVEEKLEVMEAIWSDLCARAEGVPSYAWHGELLAEREARLERGEAVVEDWEEVKERIRREIQ